MVVIHMAERGNAAWFERSCLVAIEARDGRWPGAPVDYLPSSATGSLLSWNSPLSTRPGPIGVGWVAAGKVGARAVHGSRVVRGHMTRKASQSGRPCPGGSMLGREGLFVKKHDKAPRDGHEGPVTQW